MAARSRTRTSNSGPLRADAVRFRERISGVLMKSVDEHKAAIADETNETRYLSYQALCGIERDFGKSPPGQAAREAVSAISRESWLTGEKGLDGPPHLRDCSHCALNARH